jgi:hypothetical protein
VPVAVFATTLLPFWSSSWLTAALLPIGSHFL